MRTLLVRSLHRLGTYRWFAVVASSWAPRADMWLHRRTSGRRMLLSALFPVRVVTTTGRRSGLPRRTPLLTVDEPGGPGCYVVGSNFGMDRPPAWALNLMSDGRATVEYDGVDVPVTAELLTGPARDRAWQRMAAVWPPYRAYAAHTSRDFPLFRLSPAAA
jgi:deazaflavin-dependent oxidoreductase (nitroreductase family)